MQCCYCTTIYSGKSVPKKKKSYQRRGRENVKIMQSECFSSREWMGKCLFINIFSITDFSCHFALRTQLCRESGRQVEGEF